MDKNLLKGQLKTDLDLINEQTETILGYSDRIPQIELDLLRNNVIEFYEKLVILGKQNTHTLAREIKAEVPVEKVIEKAVIIEKVPEPPVVIEKTVESEPEIEPVVSAITEETMVEVTVEKTETTTVKETSKKQKSTIDLFSEAASSTVADKLSGNQSSLNDSISKEKTETSLNSKVQKQPIKDLKNAIGINEKFLFINELFDGNMHEYNDALNRIQTSCQTFSEAEEVLNNLKDHYHWNENKSSVSLFRNLVERRFL
ncbi:MAG: hypothetical protein V2A54_01700 [Bacteroidota bacterium]